MSSQVLVALRVKATPERAFEAFVGEIGAWWRANPLFAFTPREPGVLSFEPGEGGRLIETLASGKVFEIGRIRAWEPPHRLVFGWRQAAFAPGQDTEVEVRFEPVGDGDPRHRRAQRLGQRAGRPRRPPRLPQRSSSCTRHGEWWQALLASYKSLAIGGGG